MTEQPPEAKPIVTGMFTLPRGLAGGNRLELGGFAVEWYDQKKTDGASKFAALMMIMMEEIWHEGI
ncbi:hypothetical protein [Paenibacillus sp. SYP-B4298]|uniref:hypothetical protein n=1 Tax=Paenibacillus sp. SYP-B4298 TaxID=2996034 RepID=UPI0022DE6A41|nr:hypothetical protein [Paenibacillus sp. SYP-B4298]